MGCFLAPVAEAIVVTAAAVIVRTKENKTLDKSQSLEKKEEHHKNSNRLFRLTYLLYGGAILLLFEHIWHGEIIPTFPFFSAVRDGTTSEMLHEIATTGVIMAVLCTLIWGVAELIRAFVFKKNEKEAIEK